MLHPSYPSVFISSVVYAEINSNLEHPKTTISSIIRTIMTSLISLDDLSNNMNFTKVKELFPNQYNACVGKLKSLFFKTLLILKNN
jgi:hypothetical protein